MPHPLHDAAVEALARMQRIADAVRTNLKKPMSAATRRNFERLLRKTEAERGRLTHVVEKLAAFPARPEE